MKFVKIIAVCLSLILVFVTAGILYKLLSERENTDSQESTHTNDASTTSDDSSGEDETSPTLSKADYGVEIGDLAYDFTLENYDGDEVSLSDYLGQVVVVNFFATWCGPCTSELPEFDAYYQSIKGSSEKDGEVTILMINLADGTYDTIDSTKEYYDDNGFSFPLLFDQGSTSDAYEVYSIPQTFIIDQNGVIVDKILGTTDEDTVSSIVDGCLS